VSLLKGASVETPAIIVSSVVGKIGKLRPRGIAGKVFDQW